MKTKWMIWVAFFALCVPVANAAKEKEKGNGKVVTKEISVSDYKEIEVGISYSNKSNKHNDERIPTFNYTQKKGSSSLQITADENLFSSLDITVSNGKLTIRTKSGEILQPTRLVMNGNTSALEKIKVSGGMNFVFANDFTGDDLEVNASGASDVYMHHAVRVRELDIESSGASDLTAKDLVCQKIEVKASGSSDVNLSGKADEGEYKASGSSDISAYKFIIKDLECSASGSSDIQAHATGTLKASASGSSDIMYKGNPKADVKGSSSSDVIPVR